MVENAKGTFISRNDGVELQMGGWFRLFAMCISFLSFFQKSLFKVYCCLYINAYVHKFLRFCFSQCSDLRLAAYNVFLNFKCVVFMVHTYKCCFFLCFHRVKEIFWAWFTIECDAVFSKCARSLHRASCVLPVQNNNHNPI